MKKVLLPKRFYVKNELMKKEKKGKVFLEF